MRPGYRTSLVCLAFAALLCACQGSAPDPDGGSALPLDVRLSPGEVRAGVITRESELLRGPEAHGWLGDFKLYNDRVAFVVQNVVSRSWAPYGGTLLDADIIREEGDDGREVFQEMFPLIGLLGVAPVAAEIVAGNGPEAIVRITGRHQGIPLVDAALNGALTPEDLEITQDYILEPDVSYLRVQTRIRSRTRSDIHVTVGDMVLAGDMTTGFVPGAGVFSDAPPGGEVDYLGAFSPDSCSLYTRQDDGIFISFSIEDVTPLEAGAGAAPSVKGDPPPLTVERILIVGAGGMDACLRVLHEVRKTMATGLLGGKVSLDGSEPVGACVILARDTSLPAGQDVVNQTYSNPAGDFEMLLPAGEYLLAVQAPGREEVVSAAVTVTPDQTSNVSLGLPPPARLAYRCQGLDLFGADTGLVPCKVSLQAGQDTALSTPVHLPSLTFGLTGEGEIIVPPGDWTVTLSRGWEYSIHRQNITAEAGKIAPVAGALQRQVDTGGFIAADLHTHCTRSADSRYLIEDKIASNICEGVELVVITDHDCQTDFTPFIQEMRERLSVDMDALVRVVTGNEVSPLYAHMTTFPLPTHPTGWIYWQIPWALYLNGLFVRSLEFPEIWAQARRLGAEIINLAHPLDNPGYFNYLGFDPPESLPPLDSLDVGKFGTDFDTLELLNSDSTAAMLERIVPLWSHLNNQGLFKTAVGVSDSHSRSAEAGFGRTLVLSSTDQPGNLDLNEIWTNLRARRAMVGGGIFVRIRIGDATPGDLVTLTPPFDVHLIVEAADWVPADELSLLANGEILARLSLSPAGALDPEHPAVRFDAAVTVDPTVDTWYAAVATGPATQTLDPVFRGCRAVGMTNAVQVDVDGDGKFTPADSQ